MADETRIVDPSFVVNSLRKQRDEYADKCVMLEAGIAGYIAEVAALNTKISELEKKIAELEKKRGKK